MNGFVIEQDYRWWHARGVGAVTFAQALLIRGITSPGFAVTDPTLAFKVEFR